MIELLPNPRAGLPVPTPRAGRPPAVGTHRAPQRPGSREATWWPPRPGPMISIRWPTAGWDRRPPVVYYDRDVVHLTGDWLRVGRHRFPVDRLRHLRRTRTSGVPSGQRAGFVAAAVATAVVAVAAATARGYPPAAVVPVVLILTLVAGGVGSRHCRARRRFRLWADLGGTPVLLHEATDGTEFGKLCRALARAHGRVGGTD